MRLRPALLLLRGRYRFDPRQVGEEALRPGVPAPPLGLPERRAAGGVGLAPFPEVTSKRSPSFTATAVGPKKRPEKTSVADSFSQSQTKGSCRGMPSFAPGPPRAGPGGRFRRGRTIPVGQRGPGNRTRSPASSGRRRPPCRRRSPPRPRGAAAGPPRGAGPGPGRR